jgi:molybdate transport system ATP-binding protein
MADTTLHTAPAWLRLEQATLRLGGHLFFRGIDWEARDGEQWALLGANGAGKTALASLATGTLHPAGGSVWLRQDIDPGRDIGHISFEMERRICEDDARHDISEYLDTAVDQGTTAGGLLHAVSSDVAAIAEAVEALSLGHLLGRGMRFLSSGERRRTLLARLLLQAPAVAVLDAPFEGIDARSRELMHAMLARLLASRTRVLLLTRRPEDIPPGITHVLLLDEGRVVARGPRQELSPVPSKASSPKNSIRLPPLPAEPDVAGTDTDAPLIELQDVHAHYGENAVLDGVNFRMERGEHLCLAGPNGCGKSTLLALVCGDNPRAYGQSVRVCGQLRGGGEPVWELKRRFGLVSNALHLDYPKRTRVRDVVLSGFHDTLGLYENCSSAELTAALAWLEALGLGAQSVQRFDALSFGTQRLVLIARAMVKAPPILILDEPCSGLDGPNRARVLELIEQIGASGRTTILYVSHEAEETPRCIRRRIEFRPRPEGGFALVQA